MQVTTIIIKKVKSKTGSKTREDQEYQNKSGSRTYLYDIKLTTQNLNTNFEHYVTNTNLMKQEVKAGLYYEPLDMSSKCGICSYFLLY